MKFLFWNLIIWMSNLHIYEGKSQSFLLTATYVTNCNAGPLVKTKSIQHSTTDHVYVACCGLPQPHTPVWANKCWILYLILYTRKGITLNTWCLVDASREKHQSPGFLVTGLTPLDFFLWSYVNNLTNHLYRSHPDVLLNKLYLLRRTQHRFILIPPYMCATCFIPFSGHN